LTCKNAREVVEDEIGESQPIRRQVPTCLRMDEDCLTTLEDNVQSLMKAGSAGRLEGRRDIVGEAGAPTPDACPVLAYARAHAREITNDSTGVDVLTIGGEEQVQDAPAGSTPIVGAERVSVVGVDPCSATFVEGVDLIKDQLRSRPGVAESCGPEGPTTEASHNDGHNDPQNRPGSAPDGGDHPCDPATEEDRSPVDTLEALRALLAPSPGPGRVNRPRPEVPTLPEVPPNYEGRPLAAREAQWLRLERRAMQMALGIGCRVHRLPRGMWCGPADEDHPFGYCCADREREADRRRRKRQGHEERRRVHDIRVAQERAERAERAQAATEVHRAAVRSRAAQQGATPEGRAQLAATVHRAALAARQRSEVES
jgi:hypothetical protein